MPTAGFNGNFQVDDSGGTLRDISPYLRDVTFTYEGEELSTDRLGELARRRIGGLKDWSISIEGYLDTTALVGTHTVLPGIVMSVGSVQFSPLGTGSGNPQVTGEALCTSYEIGDAVDGLVEISAEFAADGDATFATI